MASQRPESGAGLLTVPEPRPCFMVNLAVACVAFISSRWRTMPRSLGRKRIAVEENRETPKIRDCDSTGLPKQPRQTDKEIYSEGQAAA